MINLEVRRKRQPLAPVRATRNLTNMHIQSNATATKCEGKVGECGTNIIHSKCKMGRMLKTDNCKHTYVYKNVFW